MNISAPYGNSRLVTVDGRAPICLPPLQVDCSLEYDFSDLPPIPANAEPLLMIAPWVCPATPLPDRSMLATTCTNSHLSTWVSANAFQLQHKAHPMSAQTQVSASHHQLPIDRVQSNPQRPTIYANPSFYATQNSIPHVMSSKSHLSLVQPCPSDRHQQLLVTKNGQRMPPEYGTDQRWPSIRSVASAFTVVHGSRDAMQGKRLHQAHVQWSPQLVPVFTGNRNVVYDNTFASTALPCTPADDSGFNSCSGASSSTGVDERASNSSSNCCSPTMSIYANVQHQSVRNRGDVPRGPDLYRASYTVIEDEGEVDTLICRPRPVTRSTTSKSSQTASLMSRLIWPWRGCFGQLTVSSTKPASSGARGHKSGCACNDGFCPFRWDDRE